VKIEIFSTLNPFCQKFAVSVVKLQLLVLPTFLTHNAADCPDKILSLLASVKTE